MSPTPAARRWRVAVGASVLILLLACAPRGPVALKGRFLRMDTVVDVTVVAERSRDPEPLWSSIDSLLKDWEERFSQTGARSEVRRLNERTSDTVTVSPVLAEMLETARAYGDTLQGVFDLTVLPLKELWGFGEQGGDTAVPSAGQIAEALESVDYRRVGADAASRAVHFSGARTRVDVGGVAKGFALREVGRLLDARGLSDYLVVAGGDILSRGRRNDGRAWKIGIQHPRSSGELLAVVDIDSGAVVTSGDYERFRFVDGVRYHHIFDPRTGACCRANQSMTVWGADPVVVDILSTALFCMDPAEVLDFVNRRPRFECVGVDSAGTVYMSDGWEEKVRLMPGR